MNILVAVAIVILVAIAIVAAIIDGRRRQERLDELFAYANSQGFEYRAEGLIDVTTHSFFGLEFHTSSDELADNLDFFELFERGHSQRSAPVLIGRFEIEPGFSIDLFLFDYQYKITTSTGKSTTTVTYDNSVVLARVPVHLPQLKLEPQNVLHKFASMIGVRELQLEDEEFNARYYVTTHQPKESVELLHPKMIEFLNRTEMHTWQTFGPFVMIFNARLVPVAEYHRMRTEISDFAKLIPNYMRKDLRAQLPTDPTSL